MPNSALEKLPAQLRAQLPAIIDAGRREAEQALSRMSGEQAPLLRTCEWILPADDKGLLEWINANRRRGRGSAWTDKEHGRLIQGDELAVLAALLAEKPSMRGRLGLVFLDPLLAVPDSVPVDIAPFLSGLAARLMLVRQLLGRKGMVCLRIDPRAVPLALAVIIELFSAKSLFSRLFPGQEDAPAIRFAADGCILFCRKSALRPQVQDIFAAHAATGSPASFGRLLEGLVSSGASADFSDDSTAAFFSAAAESAAAAADRLGRPWIASAAGRAEAGHMRTHLLQHNVRPFLFQVVQDRDRERRRESVLLAVEMRRCILQLYGAEPLPSESNPDDDLGQMISDANRTLVRVALPGRPTDGQAIAKLVALRDTAGNAWDKAVLLVWESDALVASRIAVPDDPRLELVMICPDLFDVLNNDGPIGKLEGQPCFVPFRR